MNAIIINNTGDATEVFQKIQTNIPDIKDDQVLIKVMATSINPIDLHLRKGNMPALLSSFPAVLHGDVAGIVTAVGTQVTTLKEGDRVYGWIGGFTGAEGALADYIAADHRLLAHIPAHTSFRQAAALPLVALTAYEALFDRAKIQGGQKILIYGAAGGVGHIGVQLANIAGAEVFAIVTKDEDLHIVKQLGAHHVFNYHHHSLEDIIREHTNDQGFDVVFDTVGNQNLANSFQAVAVNGQVVTTISLAAANLTPLHLKAASLHVVFLVLPIAYGLKTQQENMGTALRNITQWTNEGKISILTDPTEFSFDNVAAAHQYAEQRNRSGKIILTNHN